MKQLALRKGFTLVELLIVIALLGALAIGLLAAIDPFEQLKKGRDTAIRNAVTEFHNATIRYYAIKGEFPWGSLGGLQSVPVSNTNVSIDAIIGLGELKTNYTTLISDPDQGRILVTSTGRDDVAVCFDPESKSFDGDPNTMYDAEGVEIPGCKSDDPVNGSDLCYWCVR